MRLVTVWHCAILGAVHGFQQPQSLLQQPRQPAVQPGVPSPLALFNTAIDEVVTDTTSTANSPHEKAEQKNSYDWKKQWYPVLPISFLDGQQLEKRPYKMKICGENLVIWKSSSTSDDNDGTYSIMLDTCSHRRALLSNGKVKNDECNTTSNSGNVLACRYHGWEFNKDGECTHIPMMPNSNEEEGGFAMRSKAFSVPSFPTQMKGGLLWVYMDANDANPSPLSEDVCKLFNEDDQDLMVSVVMNPISWQSMTENFFDPSHAPYTHEGEGFKDSLFSPNRTVPIKTFDLFEPVSERGFAVSHSPYQLPPLSKSKGLDTDCDNTPESKRWFVSPVTCHAESYNPAITSTIYFVPTQEGECMTIGVMPEFKTPKFIPKMLMDFARFFYMKNNMYKFLSQDRIIMQSQDERKIHDTSKGWEDLSPAIADKGVKAFQSWTKQYGRPQFTMPSPLQKGGRQFSFWDSIAKYDMACTRTIQRLGVLAKRSRVMSHLAFSSSIGTALGAIIAKQKEILLMKSALGLLLAAVASRYVRDACLRTIDSVYWNPEHMAKYKTMDIYA